MAPGPITSWQIEGEKVGAVTKLVFLDFKKTAEGDCSHEIKRHLLFGRKAMTSLGSVYKAETCLLTMVLIVNGFSIVMYGCESWTIKKAEHQRIYPLKLWCRRRLLKVPWIARRSNLSILKESVLNIHWKIWCWSWNSNTLAIYAKSQLIGKDLDAGKDWRPKEKWVAEDEMVR